MTNWPYELSEPSMTKHEEIMAMEVSTHEGKSLSDMFRWEGPNGEVVYVFGDGTRSELVDVEGIGARRKQRR